MSRDDHRITVIDNRVKWTKICDDLSFIALYRFEVKGLTFQLGWSARNGYDVSIAVGGKEHTISKGLQWQNIEIAKSEAVDIVIDFLNDIIHELDKGGTEMLFR